MTAFLWHCIGRLILVLTDKEDWLCFLYAHGKHSRVVGFNHFHV